MGTHGMDLMGFLVLSRFSSRVSQFWICLLGVLVVARGEAGKALLFGLDPFSV